VTATGDGLLLIAMPHAGGLILPDSSVSLFSAAAAAVTFCVSGENPLTYLLVHAWLSVVVEHKVAVMVL
jgi:hypothetical protein